MTLLDDLVWLVDTFSVTGHEQQLAAAVADRLDPVHPVHCTGPAVVVGEPDDRPQITLYGHLDTVPEQGNRPARVDGDRLHGLGCSDMKAGLAVMIGLLEDDAVRTGPYNVTAVFYDREEGPADENGLEDLLDGFPWLVDAEFAVVMEPTDLQLEVGCQGALNATVSFSGKAAHSARPWLGENAVTKAGAWLAAMHEHHPRVVVVDGYEFRELYSVTTASGGIARNVIPPSFDVNLNYRFPPSLSLDEAEANLRDVASAADAIEIVDRAPAAPIPAGNRHYARLKAVSGAVATGKQAWTDVARLTQRGVAAVNYGPGETAQAHQQAESVAIANLDTAFEAMRRFLTEE